MGSATKDDDLWLQLFSHYTRLTSVARSRGAGDDAEDVVSTVLLRIASGRRFPAQSLRNYLNRAVCNEVVDRKRRYARIGLIRKQSNTLSAEAVDDRAIAHVEATRLLKSLSRTQSPDTMRMIHLRMLGNTWREIADQVDEKPSKVQARVRRAFLSVKPLTERTDRGGNKFNPTRPI